ncbi:putative kinetochore protein spc24 [Oleoguttula sp. CCFEE 5521]
MLFDEAPEILIRETTTQFKIAPDTASLQRVSQSIASLHATRQASLQTQQRSLKNLSRRLNALQTQREYEESHHNAGAHASSILALDGEKFRTAKSAYDTEIETERLQSELSSTNAQIEQLEREGPEGGVRRGEEAEDEVVLKLCVLRGLGVEVESMGETGGWGRVVVRDIERGDVRVLGSDGARVAREDVWAAMG